MSYYVRGCSSFSHFNKCCRMVQVPCPYLIPVRSYLDFHMCQLNMNDRGIVCRLYHSATFLVRHLRGKKVASGKNCSLTWFVWHHLPAYDVTIIYVQHSFLVIYKYIMAFCQPCPFVLSRDDFLLQIFLFLILRVPALQWSIFLWSMQGYTIF